MSDTPKKKGTVTVSNQPRARNLAISLGASRVPPELLKKYTSDKPLRRPPPRPPVE